MAENSDLVKVGVYCKFFALDWWIIAEEHQSAYQLILRLAEQEASSHENQFAGEGKNSHVIDETEQQGKVSTSLQDAKDRHNRIKKLAKLINIVQAAEIFSRHSLVVIASFFEGAVRELFECLFCRHPMRMYQFLLLSPDNPVQGKVDLREIVEESDLRRLIRKLAKRASSQAVGASFEQTIKNLDKVSTAKLDIENFSDLSKYIEKRHQIIHEDYEVVVEPNEVLAAYDAYFQVLRYFEDIANANDINVASIDEYDS